MPLPDAHDDLWLGMLAVQTGLVAPEVVLSAARSLAAASESLGESLVRLGAISTQDQQLLESLHDRLAASGSLPEPAGWAVELQSALRPVRGIQSLSAAGKTPDPGCEVIPVRRPAVNGCDPTAPTLAPVMATLSTSSGRGGPSRFQVIRLHARGGLGKVSVAIDEELRREVALKEIQPSFADDVDARARFIREAEITGSLEHPGIVPVYGLGVSPDGRPYYAMRFIQGRSMQEAIDEYPHDLRVTDSETTLRFRDLLRRFSDACHAVAYAHSRGIIHRDLKPGNVMLGPYGETLVVDWGLAKPVEQPDSVRSSKPLAAGDGSGVETQHGSALGTPQYMSPEQADGEWTAVGPASDVYSLGATLYHLLTGRPPFTARQLDELLDQVRNSQFHRPRAVRPTVPAPLEAICLKAMAARPEDRYASVSELVSDLEHWLADEPIAGYREGFQERWFRRLRRHRTWTLTLATVLPILLVVMTTAAIWVEGARREAIRQKELSDDARQAEARQKGIAETNAALAREQETKAVAATAEARRSLVQLLLASGDRLQSEGDLGAAALWFAKALPLVDPSDTAAIDIQRRRLAILLRQLPRPVVAWTLSADQRRLVARQFISPDGRQVVFSGRTVVGVSADTGQPLWPALPFGKSDLIAWVGYSLDGSRLITLAQPRQVRVWDARTGQPLTTGLETEHSIPITGSGSDGTAELSTDNRALVVTTTPPKGRGLEVWDVAAGRRRFPPLAFPTELEAVAFSPDNRKLMVACEEKLQFFDVETGQPAEASIPVSGLWHASYSSDGRWIATASGEGSAQLWDAMTLKPIGPALTHRGPVTRVVFSPDAQRLLTLSGDRTARIWNVTTGKPVGDPLEHAERPFSGEFSADGRRVWTVTLNQTVHLWDAATGRQLVSPWRHVAEPTVRTQGDTVLVAVDGRGAQFDVSRAAAVSQGTVTGIERIKHLAFTADGQTLAAGASEQAWLLESPAGKVKLGPLVHGGLIRSMAISPDGKWFVTAGDDGFAQLWNTSEGRAHGERLRHAKPVLYVQFDATGRRLLTCSEDQTVRLWDVASGKPIGAPLTHRATVRHGDINPDGRWVITASDDGSARIWSALNGQPRAGDESVVEFKPQQPVKQVRFHPDGELVLAASGTGRIVVWSPFHRQNQVASFILEGAGLETAIFSPDGKYLLAAGLTNAIRVWNWRSAELPPAVLPVATAAFHAQFHPGSTLVAATSFDGVRLWEAESGRTIGTRLGPLSSALTFSPDGSWLVGADEALRWWEVTPDRHEPKELEKLVSLLAQREIDARGAIQFLSAERIEALQRELSRTLRDDFQPLPPRIEAFGSNSAVRSIEK